MGMEEITSCEGIEGSENHNGLKRESDGEGPWRSYRTIHKAGSRWKSD